MLQPLTHLSREPAPRAPPGIAARREERLWTAVCLADTVTRQELESLAAWCDRITPLVCLAPPDGLLLEVRGSLKLFGGLEAIERELTAKIAVHYPSFHLCAAPTPLGALWLARRQGANVLETSALAGSLGPLPLWVTHWPEDTLTLLNEMGVRSIGDCLRLPRDGFARRVGRCHLRDLDRALGRRSDPRARFEKPRNFSSRIEFPNEIEDREMLGAALGTMVARLVDSLRSHQRQAQKLEIILHHANRPPTVSGLELIEPVHEASRLFDPLAARLESMVLPAPVIAVGLRVGAPGPMRMKPPALFGEKGQAAGRPVPKAGLIERLRGRFGIEGVCGFGLAAEHRPELGWTRLTGRLLETSSGRKGEHCERAVMKERRLAARPLWILPSPLPLPQGVSRLRCRGSLRMGLEPERIESGWWDGGDVRRDYFTASASQGEKLWVYQDRVTHEWFLHGLFG